MTECEYACDNGTESCRWWECSTGSEAEWALESKPKSKVGAPESLRYRTGYVNAYRERMQRHQAGWHRRNDIPVPAIYRDRIFFVI